MGLCTGRPAGNRQRQILRELGVEVGPDGPRQRGNATLDTFGHALHLVAPDTLGCARCGRSTHWAKECKALKDVNGTPQGEA